jgi:hydrogenase maturation factor
MCIARVGRVVEASGGKATVEFFDGKTLGGIDVKMAKASQGTYVEVFGDVALSVLSVGEAKVRRRDWAAVRRAASAVVSEAARR